MILAPMVLALSLFGCSPTGDDTAPAKTPGSPSADALAVLAKADAVDGTTDKVVSKCVTCALGMDGSADHAVTVGNYKLHLCSDACKKKFDTDSEKALLALKVPEVKAPDLKVPGTE
jgi:hypothetical protein